MRLSRRIRDFLAGNAGTSTVEFVLAFPAFMTVFLSVFESGLLMTRQVMLERGLDVTVRAIRTAAPGANITQDTVRQMICDNAGILPDCEDNLLVELVPISTATWTMPDAEAECVDRAEDIEPVVTFDTGGQNQIMFIRACFVVDPFFPTTGLGLALPKDVSGGYHMVATGAFANEPS